MSPHPAILAGCACVFHRQWFCVACQRDYTALGSPPAFCQSRIREGSVLIPNGNEEPEAGVAGMARIHSGLAGVKLRYLPRVILCERKTAQIPSGAKAADDASARWSAGRARTELTESASKDPDQTGQVNIVSLLRRPVKPVVATVDADCGTTGKNGSDSIANRFAPRTVLTGSLDGSSQRRA